MLEQSIAVVGLSSWYLVRNSLFSYESTEQTETVCLTTAAIRCNPCEEKQQVTYSFKRFNEELRRITIQ